MILLDYVVRLGQMWFVRNEWDEVIDKIKEGWDDGCIVTDIDYGDGVWSVVMTKTVVNFRQSLFLSRDFSDLTDKIESCWKKGQCVTSITYDGRKWIGLATTISCYSNQGYVIGSWDYCIDAVKDRWRNNRYVTSIACDGDTYLFISSRIGDDVSYSQSIDLVRTNTELKKLKNKCLKGNRIITDMHNMSGYLVVVTSSSDHEDEEERLKICSTEDIKENISKVNANGFYVASMAYYDHLWFIAFRRDIY